MRPHSTDVDQKSVDVCRQRRGPDVWGRGVGQALRSAAVEARASDGFVDLVLWVHPDNHRARGFYERAGW